METLFDLIEKHLKAFNASDYNSGSAINDDVAKMFDDYGFISDHGVGFSEKYCGGEGVPTHDVARLKEILASVGDIKDVGSLYVSYWREVTHFMESNPFIDNHKDVFVAILETLKRILDEKLKK
ncbi:MAG: hypothetical protein LUD47_07155 [Clostridia bacterium]|nr:hypothetical protein [Clostridia bacterium]